MAKPRVAIVILNWNGVHFLEQFLPSVLASTYENKEVVVIDNASTDTSVAYLREQYPQVRVVINDRNYGFAGGYNEGLKQVTADYYILLNSDVEVEPNWIEPMVALLEADEKRAACAPKILSYHQKDHFEYAGAAGGYLDHWGYAFARGRVLELCEKDEGQYNDAIPVFWATGASLFIRAKVYWEMGGFDASFFAHQEEIDLCWRMQWKGYEVWSCPQSVVYHFGGGTLPKGNSRKVYLNFRNSLYMLSKNWPASEKWWRMPVRIGLDTAAAYRALLKGDSGYWWAVAKAHKDYVVWLFKGRPGALLPVKNQGNWEGYWRGSMVYAALLKKKEKFDQIVKNK